MGVSYTSLGTPRRTHLHLLKLVRKSSRNSLFLSSPFLPSPPPTPALIAPPWSPPWLTTSLARTLSPDRLRLSWLMYVLELMTLICAWQDFLISGPRSP